MRKQDPYLAVWDIGGNERLRYEIHEGYGIAGVPGSPPSGNNDFRDHGADVSNDYLMSKLRFHVGYSAKWWSAYVEGRSSFVDGDERWAYFASPVPPATAN